jgi:LacI family transcriptional regulator
VTLLQVADMAGVSQATASLVLTNAPDVRIAQVTRARVLAAAEKLGYRRRGRFANEGSQRRVIGLIVDHIDATPFASLFVAGARERAMELGITLVTFDTGANDAIEVEAAGLLRGLSAIGLIYAVAMPLRINVSATLAKLPLVLVNCVDVENRWPAVLCGDYSGAYAATNLLIAAGHRRIAHMSADPAHFASQERERGFRVAMADAELPVDEMLVAIGGGPSRNVLENDPIYEGRLMPGTPGWSVPIARESARLLLDRPDRPTAIFCFHDRMAMACYDVARALGVRIPDELSIVGFDDEFVAEALEPPLTTMLLPHFEMGARAIDMLVQPSTHLSGAAASQWVDCPPILRASIAAPPSV